MGRVQASAATIEEEDLEPCFRERATRSLIPAAMTPHAMKENEPGSRRACGCETAVVEAVAIRGAKGGKTT
jgi:hypothetical protein